MGQPDEERQRIDNPVVVNDVLSFLIYGTTRAEVQGPRSVSPRSVAHSLSAFVLRLPHHGWPGYVLCAADDGGCSSALARQTFHQTRWMLWPLLLELPATVHCQYRWMDHRGDRPATLDCLRPSCEPRKAIRKLYPPAIPSLPCWDLWACTPSSRFCSSFWSIAPSTKARVPAGSAWCSVTVVVRNANGIRLVLAGRNHAGRLRCAGRV